MSKPCTECKGQGELPMLTGLVRCQLCGGTGLLDECESLMAHLKSWPFASEFHTLRHYCEQGHWPKRQYDDGSQKRTAAEFRASAEVLLNASRQVPPRYRDINSLISVLAEGEITPEKIGSSCEEIAKIFIAACEYQATQNLRELRKIPYIEDFLDIQARLGEGGLKPEDVGTSKDEIANLDQVLKKEVAANRLYTLKTYPKVYELSYIMDTLDHFGLKPEDIGTSAKELAGLTKK